MPLKIECKLVLDLIWPPPHHTTHSPPIPPPMGSAMEEREPCGTVNMQQWLCHHSAKTVSDWLWCTCNVIVYSELSANRYPSPKRESQKGTNSSYSLSYFWLWEPAKLATENGKWECWGTDKLTVFWNFWNDFKRKIKWKIRKITNEQPKKQKTLSTYSLFSES